MPKYDRSEDRADIAGRIKTIREQAGYTQEEFASLLSVSKSALKKIESGENQISVAGLYRLKEKLGISADRILFGNDTAVDGLWEKIFNSSERDKMYIMLQLLDYFTFIKKPAVTGRREQENMDEIIERFLDTVKKTGDK